MYSYVYVTFPNEKIANKICEAVINDKIATCANIVPGSTIYRWKGSIEKSKEIIAFIKTRSDLVKKVADKVREMHPYEVPCIVAFDISKGSKPYLDWISENTQAPE